ncbi:c-type cytochrome [Spiribacter halobius]|uniref:Cytochrome C n=1 Tax=Sediminicurvatus halobius TaxID=2182432 RepID=A0A2U2MW32_9GAMM|nr:cytochrome c [Spiribacter halobius]PWG61069.1 cytochrome C [Spiribacter halobius]UEX79909.1 cytochrome c [Spiribacter halobius]
MTPKLLTALGVTLALLLPGAAFAQGDVQAGREKAYTCLGCHGVSGYRNAYPSYNVPKLGGQHADYIVSALQAYKAGDRSHPTMQGLAQTLSEEDMQDIAAYFEQAVPNDE